MRKCEGTLTANGKATFCARFFIHAAARSTASFAPAMTTWPGELKFTADTTSPCSTCLHALIIASLSKTNNRIHCTRYLQGSACCINLPRNSTNLIASLKSMTPAQTNAEYSPKLVTSHHAWL